MTSAPRILNLLSQAARTFADKPALISGTNVRSYRDVIRRVRVLAAWLSGRAPAGATAIIIMRNNVDAAVLPLALQACGLVRVPVNWRMSVLELGNVIKACDAALVIHDESCAQISREAIESKQLTPSAVTCQLVSMETLAQLPDQPRCNARLESPGVDDTSLASINFTSGTLGVPKGVMQSHRNWEFVYRNILAVRDFRASDVVALMGPLSHAAGTYVVPLLLSGATIVLPQETGADALAEEFSRRRITVLQCVPTLLTRLLESQRFCDEARRSLRLIIYGAESIPYATLRSALDIFGPILAQNYGLTEAMMTCATLPPDEHVAEDAGRPSRLRHGIVGRPYPFVEIALRRDDGAEVENGETGEITVRSPHVMLGYWRDPEATAAVLRGGWLWTGDLARWTADGYLELVGRSKDMIISGGMNIYPAEVQAFLTRLKGVQECAAFGIKSREWGEELVAAMVFIDQTESARDAFCRLARHELGIRTPKRWLFLDGLPRTGNGKVDFAALRAMVEPPG